MGRARLAWRERVLIVLVMLAPAGLEAAPVDRDNVQEPLSAGAIRLEIPELGKRTYPPGVLRIPEPEVIRRIAIHIPAPRIHRVFPKINTIGTGLVQSIRTRKDEVVCYIDFALHQGRYYSFGAEDNTVEIRVVPRSGADPVYAKWVIVPPEDGDSWRAGERIGAADGSLALAEMGSEGLILLESLEDGSTVELDKPTTSARRVFVRARFVRKAESVALRIHWTGPEGARKTFSAGTWRTGPGVRGVEPHGTAMADLEGAVDLSVGLNRVEVEVVHGYTALYRGTYRILRRKPTVPGAVSGEKWAVVVGVSDYPESRLDLRYAHRDAEAIRDFLIERGGFVSDRIRFLTDERATHEEVRTALFTFLAATQPDDLVLIFLAGHGVPDPSNPDNFYFLVHDSKLDNLGGTAIPMWDLNHAIGFAIRARRILLLADTCHSAGALAGDGDSVGKLNFFNKYLEHLARKKGRLVLTASQAHQFSLEKEELGHGVFSHYLLRGLDGDADDNPADGVVTAGELVDYVQARVPRETQGEQHPSYKEEGFDMNLALAYVENR